MVMMILLKFCQWNQHVHYWNDKESKKKVYLTGASTDIFFSPYTVSPGTMFFVTSASSFPRAINTPIVMKRKINCKEWLKYYFSFCACLGASKDWVISSISTPICFNIFLLHCLTFNLCLSAFPDMRYGFLAFINNAMCFEPRKAHVPLSFEFFSPLFFGYLLYAYVSSFESWMKTLL